MRRGGLAGWVAPAALLLALGLVAALAAGCAPPSRGLNQRDLDRKPAPELSLTDQRGRPVSLAGWRGKAVALTFLYTSCPDVCPIITGTFGQVFDKLDADQGKVVLAAVSVDPERDTVPRIRQYLEAQGLENKMLFLTGDRPSLEAVWAAYHVGVIKGPVKKGEGGAPDFYEVSHQNLVYLIDPAGQQRSLVMGYDFPADRLLGELRSLIKSP